jgi:dethiobiotin synthetase
MADGVFLIGTDRDVGKTMVGVALVGLLNQRGRKSVLMTPISTGGAVESASDLLRIVGAPEPDRKLVNPIQLETLASPYVASLVEKAPIDPVVILEAAKKLRKLGFFVVVEGGGAMVPIRKDYFMLDLLEDLELPSMVVARTSRGTLNHSLLTYRALSARGQVPLGCVLNGFGRFGEGFAESLNADTIADLAPDMPVLANVEWRPEYREDFRLFVRDLERQDRLISLIDTWI